MKKIRYLLFCNQHMRVSESRVIYLFLILIMLSGFGMVWLIRLSGNVGGTFFNSPSSQQKSALPVASEMSDKSKKVFNYSNDEFPSKPLDDDVYYSATGFNPVSLKIKKGTMLAFFNFNSDSKLQLTGAPGISTQPLDKNQNVGYIFSQPGIFTITNVLTSSASAGQKVTVEVEI